jgi:hypothetical protein
MGFSHRRHVDEMQSLYEELLAERSGKRSAGTR